MEKDTLDLSKGYICSECGEIIKCGLENGVKHFEECKRNASNCNIESYNREKVLEEIHNLKEKEFAPIWPKMTLVEQNDLLIWQQKHK